MSDSIVVKSHKGDYEATFINSNLELQFHSKLKKYHFIVDKNVSVLHKEKLDFLSKSDSVLLIEANEENKSLEKIPQYVDFLVSKGVRRGHVLVPVGGGVIQDIACFLASTLLRGMDWNFVPTTLLAQADSCIGSKSSINCNGIKNIVGTFNPPKRIILDTSFLHTLDKRDLCSGIGEMLKVHAIDGPDSFDKISTDYFNLFSDMGCINRYIYDSLQIKKRYIEQDEFDLGIRNIFNYGHTFGHAIESATDYSIPHGIAVTMGMDMANYVSMQLKLTTSAIYKHMHTTLRNNYSEFLSIDIPIDKFISSIGKDKKNINKDSVALILPNKEGRVFKDYYDNNRTFRDTCLNYFNMIKTE